MSRRPPLAITGLILLGLLIASQHGWSARNGDKNLGWPGRTLTGNPCYGGAQGFGPFDYTDPTFTVAGRYTQHGSTTESPLDFVEKAHFLPEVERLERGHSSATPAGDIDYTLRAFPNHHRALWSISRFYLRNLKQDDGGQRARAEMQRTGDVPPECYFQRALVFVPEDAVVRSIFGIYLHRRGFLDAALEQYQQAESALPNYAELYYNMGLLYIDRHDYTNAKTYADKAYGLNYPLPGLRRKLSHLPGGTSTPEQTTAN